MEVEVHMNASAILVATVVGFVVGGLWYLLANHREKPLKAWAVAGMMPATPAPTRADFRKVRRVMFRSTRGIRLHPRFWVLLLGLAGSGVLQQIQSC